MLKRFIVSDQSAAVSFIRQHLPAFDDAPVLSPGDLDRIATSKIAGAEIAGHNIPLRIAALASKVYEVQWTEDGVSDLTCYQAHALGTPSASVYSTETIARQFHVSPSRVRQIARELNLGQKLNPRLFIFTEGEVAIIRSRIRRLSATS